MNTSKTDFFKKLTWPDIQEWAGTDIVSRGKGYQHSHRVQELAMTPAGALIAWVLGTERYATTVDVEEEELTSDCTCPYDGTCKHAVAVVLEYLDCLKQNPELPIVSPKDQRLALLRHQSDSEDEVEEEDVEEKGVAPASHSPSRRSTPGAIHSYLEQQTKAQLVLLLEELARDRPEVRMALEDRADLSKGTVKRIVQEVSREIDVFASKPGWTHHWNNEGYVPDYSGVRARLEALLSGGHADEVVALGKQLLEAGTSQIEMSDDEGETAEEISHCMDIVFRALAQSSLPPADQMLWAAQADLEDEYDICQGDSVFWDQEHATEDWDTLAGKLMHILEQQKPGKKEDGFSRDYRRDCLSDWVIQALENAGRQDEIIPLCEREAERTGSYVRLVDYLLKAGRKKEAEEWIHVGIKATQGQKQGVAGQLRTMLRQMREQDNDSPMVAAFRAGDFFERASLETFKELEKAANQAGVWLEVRAAAMNYLETGELPRTGRRVTKDSIPPWPLPQTGLEEKVEVRHADFPMIGTLIDIAIAEKRPEEVIRWYDERKPGSSKPGWTWWSWFQEDKIGHAVADAYPDRAIDIWKKLAESQIAQAQPKAYETAARFLRSMRRTLKKLGRESEWTGYLAQVRFTNARKKRLLEILDTLTERRIIDGS